MQCPKCNQSFYFPAQPCQLCQFAGEPGLIEQLDHVKWLLDEIDTWQWLYRRDREALRGIYLDRQNGLEIQLGLRLPLFTADEAREAWPRLAQAEQLRQTLQMWQTEGWLKPNQAQALMDQLDAEIVEIQDRLAGHPNPSASPADWERLSLMNTLIEHADQIEQHGGFLTAEAKMQALAPILVEQEALEIRLGLRVEPAPIPEEIGPLSPVSEEPEPQPVSEPDLLPLEEIDPAPKPPDKPAAPSIPLRERLWQMLLSERALQGMLFLGIFLLFSAAISFVAWGWKDFSAPLRVAIPTGFTGIFFGLGWYVRTKTPMYRSGIALSAIAALLVPIDFYTVYVNFQVTPAYWPLFWFVTSLVCLAAYTGATLMIRSQFFGYLVGTAAGSTVLALIELGHQHLGLSVDWRSTGLSGLALGLIVLAAMLTPPRESEATPNPQRIFSEPFRSLSLLTISVIMLLTFGWRFTQREGYDTLHYALTINWWLGSFIFGWGALQYRSRSLGLLAAMTLPVATYLAQAALFAQEGVSPAWHAFGWALLVPLYFIVGYKLLPNQDAVIQGHGRNAVRWGIVLLIVAAFWPLTRISDGAAASASHIILVGAVVLAALLWQRPAYLYTASLLSFSATTFAMTELSLTVAQLSVGWASLAIAHLILAFLMGTRFPIPVPLFAAPLSTAGYLIAVIALIPPLFPYQSGLLAYGLANWLGLAGWGAYLAHLKQPGFIGSGLWRKPIFHWLTVLPLPLWLWVLFTHWRPIDGTLPLALAVLAWVIILISYRLQRINPAYRSPWYLTGLLISVIAPLSAFLFAPSGFAPALTLLIVGLLYLADAITQRQSVELVPGGLVTGWGYLLLLDRLSLPAGVFNFGLACLIAIYFLSGQWATRRHSLSFTKQFWQPLYLTGHFYTLILLISIYTAVLDTIFLNVTWPVNARLWGAASQLLLAGIYAIHTWVTHKERWAHLAAWLGAGSLIFLGTTLIPTGLALATHLASVALLFILSERALHTLRLWQTTRNRQRAFIRFTWRLSHRALWIVGWLLSAGAIGLALLYNVWELEGNRAAETWAVVALLLVTLLYGLSAWLFRQVRFVWLAAFLSFIPWTLVTHLGGWVWPQPDLASYILSWAGLGWLLFSIHLYLNRLQLGRYALPLRTAIHSLLLLSVSWSLVTPLPDTLIPALGILAVGLLYFTEAIVNRQFLALVPGELFTTWGCFRLVEQLNVSYDLLSVALAVLVALYILAGLGAEWKRSRVFNRKFLSPLYLTAHLLTLVILGRIYLRPLEEFFGGAEWTDTMRLWGAAAQLILGIIYGLYAWNTYKERWGHLAAWLMALAGGFVALSYSTGRGSSAAKVALLAIALILAERALSWLRRQPRVRRRYQAVIHLAWPLYRRPLLVAGWACSGAAIGLALIRNLWLLGGGWIQQVWAITGLLLIVGLYAFSARLFRQSRFLWLAAPLLFAPWTILTHLGWFTAYRPSVAGYALSWVILSWILLLVSLLLRQQALPRYAIPPAWVAHGLMPFALLWGIANIATSRFTLALAIGFYILSAWVDHRHGAAFTGRLAQLRRTKFFYPAMGFPPIWSLYLLAWFFPTAQPDQYGLLLLVFAPLGIVTGQWLAGQAPQQKLKQSYAFPAYLAGYLSLSFGTVLTIGQPALLALVLLFDGLLLIASARLFRQAVWLYPAVITMLFSLLITLTEIGAPLNRYGWWLIGLASIYLAAAWLLRRANLFSFATAPLMAGLAVVSLSLPYSSLDQTGALWGYAGAALLYIITAFWLKQPLLLALASGLVIVPYVVLIQRSALEPTYFGLALLPGALIAWGWGWLLDSYYGARDNFPWNDPEQWPAAVIDRLLTWWALPLYTLGFLLAIASPLLVQFTAGPLALSFFCQALLFGWAVHRFRLRGWLAGTAIAGHLGVIFLFETLGWWSNLTPAQAGLLFLPLTAITLFAALFIEYYERGEAQGQPSPKSWTYPLYIILDIDITIGLFLSLAGPASTGAWVTLIHALLLTLPASFRRSFSAVYLSLGLTALALTQGVAAGDNLRRDFPIALAGLAFLYGLVGYGLAIFRHNLGHNREVRPWLGVWELPLQRSGLLISLGTLVLTVGLGFELTGWIIRAFLGLPFQQIVELDTVRMAVGVLGFSGLLYLMAALAHQWPRLGYIALGMLLSTWMLHILFIQQLAELRQLHWYIVPAGLYLAGIAYLEWQQDNKNIARWLDYAAIAGVLSTLFWQTLLFGWGHALVLGGIGLLAFFWGVGRRLRRFLYAGMVATVLATVGQLVNSFWSVNQWIVFGLVGFMLILAAIMVERKLEDIKIWQEVLESWE